ncbi:hypothetical protein FSARC_6564 [Fusarium sarcochroum]|uniref:DUF676 domain-containing protein n=1 Tax=Fusarium sarcochroum TaxID=1208366 RepID=A0A8H4TX86_9HYPO|nr:hypothetical protein FSARC_6564 [Fusarium sarcochroum]
MTDSWEPLFSDSWSQEIPDGRRFLVDIIAVSGLNVHGADPKAHAMKTWTFGGNPNDFSWLNQMASENHARLMFFTWDSRIIGRQQTISFSDQANDLVDAIRDERTDLRRPIIFVAHSLGGILVEQALIKARIHFENDDPRFSIARNTTSLIFLGTPHLGSDKTEELCIRVLRNIAMAVGYNKSQELIDILSKGSGISDLRRDDFRYCRDKFSIVSVFETDSSIIVDKTSAVYGTANEEQIASDKSHADLCRYDRHDTSLKRIVKAVSRELEKAKAKRIEDAVFVDPQAPDLKLKTSLLVLHGIPGTGKKTLISWFSNEHCILWDFVAVVNASSKKSLHDGFAQTVSELKECPPRGDPSRLACRELRKLGRFLLILTDVTPGVIEPDLLPRNSKMQGGLVIMSTSVVPEVMLRDGSIGNDYQHVAVGGMTEIEGHSLLKDSLVQKAYQDGQLSDMAVIEDDDFESLREDLLAMVHYHPLSIRLVRGCLGPARPSPKAACEYFYKSLAQPRRDGRGSNPLQIAEAAVKTVYETIINSPGSECALSLLHFFAYISTNQFSISLLDSCWENIKNKRATRSEWWRGQYLALFGPKVDQDYVEDDIANALNNLAESNLISYTISKKKMDRGYIAIHPLIQSYLLGEIGSATIDPDPWTVAMVTMAESVSIGSTKRSHRPLLDRYARHKVAAHMVAGLQRKRCWQDWFTQSSDSRDRIQIGRKIAFVFYENGHQDLALQLQELLLKQVKRGMEHTEDITWVNLYLHVMNDLAITEMELGQLSKALDRREEILRTSKDMGQFPHESTLLWTSNLAKSYRAAHRFHDALALLQIVFDSHRRSSTFNLSEVDYSQIVGVKDYATTLHANGRYAEARFWREFCLCKLRHLTQPNHFLEPQSWSGETTSTTIHDLECQLLLDLAMSFLEFGLELEAEKMCNLVYSTSVRFLANDHLDVLRTSERLSNIAWRVDQNNSRLRFWKCSLMQKCEAKYGEKHLQTLSFRTAYAETLSKIDLEYSMNLFRSVIRDQEQAHDQALGLPRYTKSRMAWHLSAYGTRDQKHQAVEIQENVVKESRESTKYQGDHNQLKDEEKLGDFLNRIGLHFDAKQQYQKTMYLRGKYSKAYNPFTDEPEMHPATIEVKHKLASSFLQLAGCRCFSPGDECQPRSRSTNEKHGSLDGSAWHSGSMSRAQRKLSLSRPSLNFGAIINHRTRSYVVASEAGNTHHSKDIAQDDDDYSSAVTRNSFSTGGRTRYASSNCSEADPPQDTDHPRPLNSSQVHQIQATHLETALTMYRELRGSCEQSVGVSPRLHMSILQSLRKALGVQDIEANKTERMELEEKINALCHQPARTHVNRGDEKLQSIRDWQLGVHVDCSLEDE